MLFLLVNEEAWPVINEGVQRVQSSCGGRTGRESWDLPPTVTFVSSSSDSGSMSDQMVELARLGSCVISTCRRSSVGDIYVNYGQRISEEMPLLPAPPSLTSGYL